MNHGVSVFRALYSLLCGSVFAFLTSSLLTLSLCLPKGVGLVYRYIVIACVYNGVTVLALGTVLTANFSGVSGTNGILTHREAFVIYCRLIWKKTVLSTLLNVVGLVLTSFFVSETYFVYVALLTTTFDTGYKTLHTYAVQKQIFQQYTAEGIEEQKNKKEKPKRTRMSRHLYGLIIIMFILMFGIVYAVITERVKPWALKSNHNTYGAISAGILVKVATNYLLRSVFMRQKVHPYSVLHLYALNITMMGTPMRLLCNYLIAVGGASMAVIFISSVEIVVRLGIIAKTVIIVHLRLKKTSMDDMQLFLKWKEKKIGLLESENYAEMLSEYVAIVFSVLIYSATERTLSVEIISLGLFQMMIEFVVDAVSLGIEQRAGIPIASVLQTYRGFILVLCINALLGTLAAIIPMYLATQKTFLDLN